MHRFDDHLRWRNLLRILRARGFQYEVVEGTAEEGIFVWRRTPPPRWEGTTTCRTDALAFLIEMKRRGFLQDIDPQELDEPDGQGSE